MFDAGLEIPRVATAVGASLQADPVTLTAGPLADVAVPVIEDIHPETVPSRSRGRQYFPSTQPPSYRPLRREEAAHVAAGAPATVELPLAGVTVVIDLHPLADGPPVVLLLRLGLVAVFVADEPLNRRSAAGGKLGDRDEG
ncbi:hypothetical protein GW17_00000879 [Ensete ventricosum]|nr:hypothetical protein GW17_00000879 [Ensete ventricosum]